MQVAFEDVRVNNGFICTQRRTLSGFGVHSSSGATVRVAGKVGELAQGVDEEGAFLVSGAISAGPYAGRASIVLGEALRVDSVDGMTKPKAFRAASRFLELHGVDPAQAGRVILETTTPVGKGLGSSSVDSALAIFAVARANDLPAHPKVVYRVLCSVERSDPVWMAGELTFTRPESGTYEVWGPQPRMLLVVWDTDPLARVDTAAAARLDADRKRHVKAYQDILSLIRSGARRTSSRPQRFRHL